MAWDIAPGMDRKWWGFSRWPGHSPAAWRELLEHASDRRAAAGKARIIGADIDSAAVSASRYNLRMAGIRNIELRCAPLHRLRGEGDPGLLVVNPPYGERIGESEEHVGLYRDIGDQLRNHMLGWEAWVLAPKALVKHVGLRPHARHLVRNGPLDCRLNGYSISMEAPAGRPKRSP